MLGVRFDLDATDALAQLDGYVQRARNPRGLFDNIGMSLVTSTQNRFEKGVGPDGSPWPPSLRARLTGGKTLVKSARLLRSISSEATESGVAVGTNVIYAAIHQLGGEINQPARETVLHFKTDTRTGRSKFSKPKKADRAMKAQIGARIVKMPARPFLGLDDDDEREIVQIAEDWIAGESAQP